MNPFVLVSSDHGPMIVSRLDYAEAPGGGLYGVGAQILERGAYEPEEVGEVKNLLGLLREYRGDGVVMVDCGANVGVHTVECARFMTGWGAVIAVEAQERLVYALAGNVALQNLFNVRVRWAAVSDRCGAIEMPLPNYFASASLGSLELRSKEGGRDLGQGTVGMQTVTARTIDTLAAPGRVDLIKIDVEGMEVEALRGATQAIRQWRPVLLVESIKSDAKELDDLLASHGYERIQRGMNVLAVHREDPILVHVSMDKRTALPAFRNMVRSAREHLFWAEHEWAVALGEAGDSGAALSEFDRLLEARPECDAIRFNRAVMRMQVKRFQDALEDYELLIGRGGEFSVPSQFGRGFSNLVLGNLREGFVDFECRKKTYAVPPPQPQWDGSQSLEGKTILILGEMGFGDNIMFMRYVPMLQARGATVVVSLPKVMVRLAQCVEGLNVFDGRDDAVFVHWAPKVDYWVMMMSLAHCFGTDLDTVPPPAQFNLPEHGRARWRTPGNNLKVGLCWSGGRNSEYDRFRNIPLEELSPLFDVPGVDFYSLVMDVRESDREAFDRFDLYDSGSKVTDFLDTACLISNLDLVITVDTATCHLAGSLGVPTWAMLAWFRTYWLWILGREDNPWYPTARAFQQRTDGDWSEVVVRLTEDLRSLARKPPLGKASRPAVKHAIPA